MKIHIGDILKSKAQTLINTVNCIGVMGKGIALEFKKHFPKMFEDYVQRCKRREVRLGEPYLFKTMFPPQIVNFPTKDHWKSVSKISDIERGLEYLLAHCEEWGIQSLAIPPLGCGNGLLEWRVVGPIIYKFAKEMKIPIEIYAPYGTNPKELTESFLAKDYEASQTTDREFIDSTINPAWVALVEILYRIQKQRYHKPVGRTIFQKIAYVATQEGLPTGFQYQEASFGPFSKNLKSAQARLINNNLLQEEHLGKMFVVKVGSEFEAIRKRLQPTLNRWVKIIEKTTDLFMRMNTDQAEIVATVMFVADNLRRRTNRIPAETEVLESVMKWKQKRRPPLCRTEVASSIRNLGMLHWLKVKPDTSLPVEDDDLL